MGFLNRISAFLNKYLFNAKWRCINCNKEIFGDEYFCERCKGQLPYADVTICQHCGRKLKKTQNYCTTCKGKLISVDKARSVYSYAPPISALIKRMKYYNNRYLAEAFALDLANLYFKNFFNADLVTFVPATKKAIKKRGYNQSELLAKEFSKLTNLPVVECLNKVKETDRQATLDRTNRSKNLKDAFKVIDNTLVKSKNIVLVDDVTTTGSTAEVIAKALKKAKARQVFVLTVASVPPKDGY